MVQSVKQVLIFKNKISKPGRVNCDKTVVAIIISQRAHVSFAQLHSHDGEPDGVIVAMSAELEDED